LRNYQSILILKPDLEEAQVDQAVEKITSILQQFGGSILKLDKWGKKRLAYRIKKSKFGYYLNIYHTCEPGKVPDLEREYQLYDLVIKYLVIRLEERDIERVMSQAAESLESSEAGAAESAKAEDKPKEATAAVGASESPKAGEEGDSKKDVAAEK
jgi:small subunit ribosomal protein S6